jgi:hypothetical protein
MIYPPQIQDENRRLRVFLYEVMDTPQKGAIHNPAALTAQFSVTSKWNRRCLTRLGASDRPGGGGKK